MRKLFAGGVLGLILLEIANVYFIMPMPGSQRVRGIDWAYHVYAWRWAFRACFAVGIAAGLAAACTRSISVWPPSGARLHRWPASVELATAPYVARVVHLFPSSMER